MRILLGAWITAMPVVALMAASADAADIPITKARLHLAVHPGPQPWPVALALEAP